MKSLKVALFGSPYFAANIFEQLIKSGFNVAVIVTQPDKKSGRGQLIHSCEAAKVANKYNIPLWQPEKIRAQSKEFFAFGAEYIICVAYGKIIPDDILNSVSIPLNIHGSILPKYRGSAPIQRAICNGEKQTGISLMKMIKEMDAGTVYATASVEITKEDDFASVQQKLIDVSFPLLIKELPAILSKVNNGVEQNEVEVTFAPMITKEEGLIDFANTAESIFNRIRAFQQWPIAYTYFEKEVLKIHAAELIELSSNDVPGTIFVIEDNYPVVATGDAALKLLAIQLPGKKIISGRDFANGYKLLGVKLG